MHHLHINHQPSLRQGDESSSPAISSIDEQQGACAEQREDRSTVGSDPSVATALEGSQTSEPTTLVHEHPVTSDPLISIRLLKDVSMTINVPGGEYVVVPLTLNAKRVQLLAYIAWRRGELIDRDKILEHVFGWGLSDEEASDDKLSERFESHKKLLRRKIREVVIEHINKPAGSVVSMILKSLRPTISLSLWHAKTASSLTKSQNI